MKPSSAVEYKEAKRIGAEWITRLRAQAALEISCVDCEALLATVSWIPGHGRPLAAAQTSPDLSKDTATLA